MKGLIKAQDIPEGSNVYLKKDFLGYRVVHPIRNEDGSRNWINFIFGGYRNLIFTIMMILFISLFVWSYVHDMAQVKDVVEHPCSYCQFGVEKIIDNPLSGLNISGLKNASG